MNKKNVIKLNSGCYYCRETKQIYPMLKDGSICIGGGVHIADITEEFYESLLETNPLIVSINLQPEDAKQ